MWLDRRTSGEAGLTEQQLLKSPAVQTLMVGGSESSWEEADDLMKEKLAGEGAHNTKAWED